MGEKGVRAGSHEGDRRQETEVGLGVIEKLKNGSHFQKDAFLSLPKLMHYQKRVVS